MNTSAIDIHADDYAISIHASEDILECIRQGQLDSISVIPNMSCFGECMEMLRREWDLFPTKPQVSVHLNLMEGKCLADKEKVSALVDQDCFFRLSWGDLWKASYRGEKSSSLAKQIKQELKCQIDRVQEALPAECTLRLDSHQHPHMLPVVWKVLLALIEEENYQPEFIRVAKEPIGPFLRQVRLYATYSPVNWVKNLILNFYALGINKDLRSRQIEPSLLWGLVMSGNMDARRVKCLYESMAAYSKRKGVTLEILFHPGSVLREEISAEYGKEGFTQFHLSEGRKREREAIEALCELRYGKGNSKSI